jgi:hypothetical protein
MEKTKVVAAHFATVSHLDSNAGRLYSVSQVLSCPPPPPPPVPPPGCDIEGGREESSANPDTIEAGGRFKESEVEEEAPDKEGVF